MRRVLLLGILLVFALVAAQGVTAEPQRKGTGILSGTVLGPDDKPVPHAVISYQSSGGNAPHSTHADARGHFVISSLGSDDYDLRATGKGVFSEWERNISVRSGRTKSITLRLIYAKEIPKAYVQSKPAQP